MDNIGSQTRNTICLIYHFALRSLELRTQIW